MPTPMRGAARARDTDPMKRCAFVLALLPTLALAPAVQARPLTTAPSLVLSVHVTITDTRIVLDPHSAPRGVEARFIIKNEGSKVHNFTLNGKTAPAGVLQRFSRTLKPQQREIVSLFLDLRQRIPYFGARPADRTKSGMKGFFVID
jgi:hypothetical protein